MAFGASTIWQVETGGTDGNSGNGGAFDPNASGMATDLAATSGTGTSPVVTSASYTFITRDEGHWLYVKSGTNWTPGWYQIASTSGGAATLSAAAGAGILSSSGIPTGVTTADGVATVASPSSGTWTIDYSHKSGGAAPIAYTDMAIDGTTNTDFTSAANPVGVHLVGNIIAVASGTGFTVQRVEVVSIQAGPKARVDKSLGTLSSTGGAGNMGGALASPGQVGALKIGSNIVFILNSGGATVDTFVMSSTANVAAGRVSEVSGGSAGAPNYWVGYETAATRHVRNMDSNWPKMRANANSMTCLTFAGGNTIVRNLQCDNNGSFTGCTGINQSGITSRVERCKVSGLATGFNTSGGATQVVDSVIAVSCTSAGVTLGSHLSNFFVSACATGVSTASAGASIRRGLIVNCTGSSGSLNLSVNAQLVSDVSIFGHSGGSAVQWSSGTITRLENVAVYGTTGAGNKNFSISAASPGVQLFNCASGGGNTADTITGCENVGMITLSADPFVNSAGSDFGLNNTAGGGAALRGAGYYPTAVFSGHTVDPPDVGAFQADYSSLSVVSVSAHNVNIVAAPWRSVAY